MASEPTPNVQREAEEAMRPSGFGAGADFSSLGDPIEKKEEKPEVDPEEGALYAISKSEGWELIEGYIADLKSELDQLVLNAISEGASFEEIGQKTTVKELAKAYLDKVLDKVETAKQAIEEPTG